MSQTFKQAHEKLSRRFHNKVGIVELEEGQGNAPKADEGQTNIGSDLHMRKNEVQIKMFFLDNHIHQVVHAGAGAGLLGIIWL